jgi:hypothetical protein
MKDVPKLPLSLLLLRIGVAMVMIPTRGLGCSLTPAGT